MSAKVRRGGRAFLSLKSNCGAYIIAFYWYQIFALDSVVVETQNGLARMEAF